MPEQNGQNGAKPQETPQGITKITVGGYKSIAQEQSIEIRPLTILAGANSSGKSSIMQPLLLLKQTLEAPYDPGALKLDGPNVLITSAEQVLSRHTNARFSTMFHVGIEMGADAVTLHFNKPVGKAINLQSMAQVSGTASDTFDADMTSKQLYDLLPTRLKQFFPSDALATIAASQPKPIFTISRKRCFLEPTMEAGDVIVQYAPQIGNFSDFIREVIHLPGLRSSPARTYPMSAVGGGYFGVFDYYVASLIVQWQSNDDQLLKILREHLVMLGLTNAVIAEPINDTQVELRVGRTLSSDSKDVVSIADVGIGVSQTLPVLVALLAAKPGQLVYLEQPEIHLHPRAQTVMAQVLADAAMRGVRVVAETHSSLLLLGVQTLVAEGNLPPELVKLHWFERGSDGMTTIRSADLGDDGAFGNWPEDFDDVSLNAQSRYLDAADAHLMRK